MPKAPRPPHHYEPHPDDVFIFPERAFAPGFEPAPREPAPSLQAPYGAGEMLRFLMMLLLLGGGVAFVSAMLV
ncbi:hypothetical protein [Rhodovarius lipocyclicus]|uniref:hypothetical protein n=1 Tax=Rhodovarius lipocyclicus TaxID=268410 RepID=UPI001358883C|nr:hypothetical protein [Rhodovarius lipocyclicus]